MTHQNFTIGKNDCNLGDMMNLDTNFVRISFGLARWSPEMVLPPNCFRADIFIVIGTSMQVYPAAGLIHLHVPKNCEIYVIDPHLENQFTKHEIS